MLITSIVDEKCNNLKQGSKMIEALHISESGLKATQAWLDNISNNIANMHTSGYKSNVVSFNDLVSSPSNDNSDSINFSAQSGLGTRISAPSINFTAGSLKQTERSLDLSINGEGLFEIVMENGDFAYTRLGNFQINNEGYLTTGNGLMLSDRIQIPADVESISITEDGDVTGVFSENSGTVSLGKIQLASVINTTALHSIGDSLYQFKTENGEVILQTAGENGSGKLLQGFLEMSNVSLVDEMTNLVLAQRAYQLNARLIQTSDQILETINNMRR
jgi:flagellar basal-body rod protein FlgG